MKRYPQDLALPALLRNLGGATQFKIPSDLSADDRASLLNYFLVPGIDTKLSGDTLSVTLLPPAPLPPEPDDPTQPLEDPAFRWIYAQTTVEDYIGDMGSPYFLTREKALAEGKKHCDPPFYVVKIHPCSLAPQMMDADDFVDALYNQWFDLPEHMDQRLTHLTSQDKAELNVQIAPLWGQMARIVENWIAEKGGSVFEVIEITSSEEGEDA